MVVDRLRCLEQLGWAAGFRAGALIAAADWSLADAFRQAEAEWYELGRAQAGWAGLSEESAAAQRCWVDCYMAGARDALVLARSGA